MVRSNPLKLTNVPQTSVYRHSSQSHVPESHQSQLESTRNQLPSQGGNPNEQQQTISPTKSSESQGVSSLTTSVFTTPSSSNSTTSAGETSNTTEQKWLALMERREARRNQLLSAQSTEQTSLQKALVDLEDRRLRMEEHRLKLEEQRIRADAINSEQRLKLEEQRIQVDAMNVMLSGTK